MEFSVNRVQMSTHCAGADVKLRGDFFVVQAIGKELEGFLFAGGQGIELGIPAGAG